MSKPDFSKHPIYFFDDTKSNYFEEMHLVFQEHGGAHVKFREIPQGSPMENRDVANRFSNRFGVAVPPALLTSYVYKDAGFKPERDVPEDQNPPLALIFDWDKTMTLRNETYTALGNSLEVQVVAANAATSTGGWDANNLAIWYLHDPEDDERIDNLKDFFKEVQRNEIPVFILTSNSIAQKGTGRELIRDILNYGLDLKVPIDRVIYSAAHKKSEKIIHEICRTLAKGERIKQLFSSAAAGGGGGAASGHVTPPPPVAGRAAPPTPLEPRRRRPMKIDDSAAGGGGGGDALGGGGGRKTRRRARRKKRRKTPRQRRPKGRGTRQKKRRKRRKKTRN